MPDIQHLPLSELKSWPRNARTHSRKQVKQLAESIRRFGFTHPVLIDENNRILAGHGRVSAAQQLGLAEVPCLRISHLSETEKRAYVLADNKLALNAGWDSKLLAEELKGLIAEDAAFDIGVTGFSIAETERLTVVDAGGKTAAPQSLGDAPARCRPGDIFQLGPHWLICSDELRTATVDRLLEEEEPRMLITVPLDDEFDPMDEGMDAEWTEAALISADEAGGCVYLSEDDPTRCDRIIQRWEAYSKRSAFLFGVEDSQEATIPEVAA